MCSSGSQTTAWKRDHEQDPVHLTADGTGAQSATTTHICAPGHIRQTWGVNPVARCSRRRPLAGCCSGAGVICSASSCPAATTAARATTCRRPAAGGAADEEGLYECAAPAARGTVALDRVSSAASVLLLQDVEARRCPSRQAAPPLTPAAVPAAPSTHQLLPAVVSHPSRRRRRCHLPPAHRWPSHPSAP